MLVIMAVQVQAIIKECPRTVYIQDLPCNVISSYNNSGNCDVNSSIWLQNNTIVQNITWAEYTPNCFFTFNIKTPAIYQYGGIETGVITVEANNNMLAIVLVYLILIAYFSLVAYIIQNIQLKFLCISLAILQILMLCGTIYANEGGFDYLPMLKINFTMMLILGFALGVLAFFSKSLKQFTEEDIMTLNEKWDDPKW